MTPVRSLQFFQVLRFGTFFLTGILFAKLGLDTARIGIYEALLFLGSVLSFFWLSGFTQSLLANYQPKERSKEFFNAFLVLMAVSAVVFVAFRLLVTPYSFLANNAEILGYYSIFSFYVLLIGPSYLVEYMLLLREKAKGLALYGVFAFGLQLIAVAGPVALGHGLEAALYGLVCSALVRFLVLVVLLFRYAEFQWDGEFVSRFLATAAPLMAATLLSGSAEYIDGLIVSKYFDEGTFAVYRYGAKEFPLIMLLANAFSNGMVPKVAQLGTLAASHLIRKESLRLMHLFFPLSIGLMLVSRWLYPRLFNADFSDSAAVFNVYLLLVVGRLVFPQTLLIGMRKTTTIMIVAAMELVVNFGLSVLLVRTYGLVGVAFATVIANVFDKLVLMVWLGSAERLSPSHYWPWRWHLAYSSILGTVYWLFG